MVLLPSPAPHRTQVRADVVASRKEEVLTGETAWWLEQGGYERGVWGVCKCVPILMLLA